MIVFDMDDTLFREVDFVKSGYEAVRKAKANTPDFDIDAEWDADTKQIMREHIPHICLRDDAAKALEYLKSRGVKTAIITDGRAITQRNKFHALGLDVYVDCRDLLISGETGAQKATGVPYSKLMNRYPEEGQWTYIGDNPAKDFVAPNRLGWTTVMLLDKEGTNVHPQTLPDDPAYHPQIIIDNLYDFIKDYIS